MRSVVERTEGLGAQCQGWPSTRPAVNVTTRSKGRMPVSEQGCMASRELAGVAGSAQHAPGGASRDLKGEMCPESDGVQK